MSLLKYIERLKRMDDLIRRRATGTPDEFAEKLGICKSMLMINLFELREMGALIKYDLNEQTYYYRLGCRLKCEFEVIGNEMIRLKGGKTFAKSFVCSNIIRMANMIFVTQGFEIDNSKPSRGCRNSE